MDRIDEEVLYVMPFLGWSVDCLHSVSSAVSFAVVDHTPNEVIDHRLLLLACFCTDKLSQVQVFDWIADDRWVFLFKEIVL